MIAVIFEAVPHPDQRNAYLDAAAALRPQLEKIGLNDRAQAADDSRQVHGS